MEIDRITACRQAYQSWRTTFGTSLCDHVLRAENRRRVDREKPKVRKRRSWGEYTRLYKRQKGLCGICKSEMVLIRGRVEIDHKNPNLPPDEFEHERNLQLAHDYCNRHKGAMSIAEQAKGSGQTYREILGPEDEI